MRHGRTPESDTPGGREGMPRRRLLGISGAALLAVAGCGGREVRRPDGGGRPPRASGTGPHSGRVAAGPRGVLSANFNEDPGSVNFSQMRDLSASWLRGFVPMPEVDNGDPANQEAIAILLAAGNREYGTILTLKFPYHQRNFPESGSPAMSAELARVDRVMRAAMGKVNILTIGNEPFIESLRTEQENNSINIFYEKVARHIIAYRKKHFGSHCRTRLYMGALNHLDRPDRRTDATERWMRFTRSTPEIEGVDIHPHVAYLEASQMYLDYILPRLRDDQSFLATEFSLILYWRRHLRDKIPKPFARRYGLNPDMPVWRLIKKSVQAPFPQAKWNDFLSMSPWFESHKHYLRNQVQKFRDTGKLAVATYGIAQADAMVTDIGPKKQPWLLNSLYADRTVQPDENGRPGRSYGWFDDFRALQREQDKRPVRTGRTPT